MNEGAFRPITLIAPEGTIFNVALDAPAGAHGEVRKRAVSVASALSPRSFPKRYQAISAAAHSPMPSAAGTRAAIARSSITRHRRAGTAGCMMPTVPALSSMSISAICRRSTTSNRSKTRCRSWLSGASSGPTAAGQANRGGVGMVRKDRCWRGGSVSVLSDRGVIPPWGILGAGSGLPYHVSIERAGRTRVRYARKSDGVPDHARRRRRHAIIGRWGLR